MWLTVEHITRYGYDGAINEAYTELRVKPLHRDGQRCSSFVLATEPRGATVDEYLDRHGNTVHHFDLLEVHESLSVTVRSEVWTNAAYEAEEPTLSPLDRWDYLAPTRYVDLDDQVLEVAASPRPPGDAVEAAWELMGAVRGAMTYERGTTNVHTTAAEALSDGRGVCQDFAHVMIAACRARGIPARYVSGYLYDTARTAARASRTPGSTSTSATRGSRSIRHTTRHRPSATSASASVATTQTSRPRAASTAAPRRRRSRSPSRSASRSNATNRSPRADESRVNPTPRSASTIERGQS